MNGYGSQRSPTATALSAIQTMTMMVWPRMYCGVPKKRAAASARRPKASSPKALNVVGISGADSRGGAVLLPSYGPRVLTPVRTRRRARRQWVFVVVLLVIGVAAAAIRAHITAA